MAIRPVLRRGGDDERCRTSRRGAWRRAGRPSWRSPLRLLRGPRATMPGAGRRGDDRVGRPRGRRRPPASPVGSSCLVASWPRRVDAAEVAEGGLRTTTISTSAPGLAWPKRSSCAAWKRSARFWSKSSSSGSCGAGRLGSSACTPDPRSACRARAPRGRCRARSLLPRARRNPRSRARGAWRAGPSWSSDASGVK